MKTSKATDAEIYTLGIFTFKLYVCDSSRLFPAIQKNSKTLSFRPFSQLVAKNFGNASDEAHRLYGTSMNDDIHRSDRLSLAPGPYLDEQNLRMGDQVLVELDQLLNSPRKSIQLLEWVRHAVVQASSCGVWGTQHPYLDPEVEKTYW